MRQSVEALLKGVIDYAGLFPPAKLPLEQAIRSYARYREDAEDWMLGRFICPAGRLSELDRYQELFTHGRPFVFSALGRGGNTGADFLDGLGADLKEITTFCNRHGPRVVVDVYEARLPVDVLSEGDPTLAFELLEDIAGAIERDGPPALKPFFECPLRQEWRAEIEVFLLALATEARQAVASHRHRSHHPGFKLRCGGTEAAAFPTTQQVAFVLERARAHAVPIKLTAGLHHPLHHLDRELGVMMHGFLNVLVGAVLGATHHLEEDALREILETTDVNLFAFDNTGVSWGDLSADEGEIGACRHGVVLSFGSCSFDEPRDHLRALRLL
jgi:hypothetical protein